MDGTVASIAKAFADVTPDEKKEFAKVAKERGESIGEMVLDLLRGYVDANRIRQ